MLKTFAVALFVMLVSFTSYSSAAMLGASKGAVQFGRPFDISIPIRIDDPQEEMSKCFSADVFQGEVKVDSGRIRLDVALSGDKQNATVRVRSTSSITEPWAKMILHSNCGAKVTRQYDFLTDFVSDLTVDLVQTGSIGKNEARDTYSIPTVTNSITSTSLTPILGRQAKTTKALKTQKNIKSKDATNKKTLQNGMAAPTKPEPRITPHLKMETFEFTNESSVMLKLSSALTEPTGMRTSEEIQALAQATAVWRAINGMPALPSADTTQTTDLTTPNSAIATIAKADKPKTTSSTSGNYFDLSAIEVGKQAFNNPLVYALMTMLALTLACIAWLWYRVHKTTQLGYAWLAKNAQEPEPAEQTNTQFLPTTFADTDFIAQSAAPEASIKIEELPPVDNTINKFKEKREFDPSIIAERNPHHFDDPRYDERQLDTHENRKNLIHEQPINSTDTLIDLIISEDEPELRAIPSHTPSLDSKLPKVSQNHLKKKLPSQPSKSMAETDKKVSSKSDPIANETGSIDFEIFAEPVTTHKPSRFID